MNNQEALDLLKEVIQIKSVLKDEKLVANLLQNRKDQIELVLKELSDQAATRLRNSNCQTECVSIFVGYSKGQVDGLGRSGWRKQLKIARSNNTKVLTEHVLKLFRENYVPGMDIRNLGVSFGKLI